VAPIDAVARTLQGIYEDNPYPTTGAIVALRMGDERRVISAGVADVSGQAKFEESTRVPVASITKTIVAAVAMELVAAGRLDLRDTVEDHLAGVVPGGEAITVEHLLSHRSGFTDDWSLQPGETWTPATLERVLRGVPRQSEPGTETHYASLNFNTLGLILERVTGRPLADLLRDRIYRPLRMEGSTLGWASPPGVRARGYVDEEDVTPENLDEAWAGGGAVSTVGDLDRFLVALYTGDLLPPAVLRTMVKPRGDVPADQGGGEYGLGIWHTGLIRCGEAWGHSGRLSGFATEAYVLADRSRSVVVLVNGGSSEEPGGPGSYLSLSLLDAALCTRP
jgi:D-alanyl-D-alanine carboxypeptidase